MEEHTYYWANDIIYMRWMKEGRVVRVARFGGDGCVALYPTQDRERFSLEAFREVDEPGMKVEGIERSEVRLNDKVDEVWLRLLDGEETRRILTDYQPSPIGEGDENLGDNRFSYYFAKRGTERSDLDYFRHRGFHIVETEERA